MPTCAHSRLSALGVYGFERLEPVILAALVTEDPLLLIGSSGTGKTYLLNSLSEALGLEHRHYNASLISFDDLVGFPYPDQEHGGVKFLETPATVWGAESVLVDEISRCKPEHQNRLFALVHERRVQGIALPRLRYRWAAMNPCSTDQGGAEDYAGSEPLDQALADRFALFVEAPDWDGLDDEARSLVADPSGEGKVTDDGGRLKGLVETWRRTFLERIEGCPPRILTYVTSATTALNSANIRISPRRSRLLARSLLAAAIVVGKETDSLFSDVLRASLPHRTWGVEVNRAALTAAHRLAWESGFATQANWIHQFLAEKTLAKKLGILIDRCTDPDQGTQAVAQFLASETRARAAAFAFATYAAAAGGALAIGAEGVNDLGKLAAPILSVSGEFSWYERLSESDSVSPFYTSFARVLADLGTRDGRYERASQFFNWCLVANVHPHAPAELEAEIEACVALLNQRVRS
ncbi:MAG: MoxR family ATPase [Candidatus Latescibacteria bacterium]|nr:MoxR family ATPase [Candidatus Latescibacterota bacterium]